MNIEYLNVVSPAESELFKLVKKFKSINLSTAGTMLNRTETAILKSVRKHRYLQFNKSEAVITLFSGEILDTPDQDDFTFDNKSLLIKRLIETQGKYSYQDYLEEYENYQLKRYDFEQGTLPKLKANTFKVHKSDICKLYWFEINGEPL